MLFNSYEFLIFFPIVLIVFFLIPGRFQKPCLLAANYIFYLSAGIRFGMFLIAATVITYAGGLLLSRFEKKLIRGCTLAFSILLTLSFLLYFKYSPWIYSMFGNDTISLVMPLGISFYTFQSMTYLIDCYRKKIPTEQSFLDYALFVSFFPCILSGPIERAGNLLPSFKVKKHFDPIRAKEGLVLMLWGYFLKMVIVSRLSILTDLVFKNYTAYSGANILIATIAFAIQIYCDFAGYSNIAIGAARILGFSVMDNFHQPYFAANVADFWRRWHISLTSWFRDYLYIPLGGNRHGAFRKYCNIMIVFLTSGLWHGANLTFLIWGALNGLYQIIGALLKPLRDKCSKQFGLKKFPAFSHTLSVSVTFLLICFSWIFFKADTLTDAFAIISRILQSFHTADLINGSIFSLGLGHANLLFVIVAIIMLWFVDRKLEKTKQPLFHLLTHTPLLLRWSIYYLLICMILLSCNLSTQEFLYMQF